FASPNKSKIIGVFASLVPGRYLNRTSSLPPYGVTSQKFVKTNSKLALIMSTEYRQENDVATFSTYTYFPVQST
ncbi:hypothetical protein ACS34_004545, partial [Salmonella enterica subsp. enterica serovar Poona]|nr:hypothetical protein [Salmonella enterica subsp. enterica serovar Poona]